MIESQVAGVLPRTQELIAKTRSYDRARITEQELEAAYKEATQIVVKGQVEAGLTRINDGMLKRQDLLRPFSANLRNVEVGPMLRWFNNNTFYKAPLIKGAIEWKESVTLKDAYYDLLPKKELKAVLPAPYTFAVMSHNTYYMKQEELMDAYAVALNAEIKALEKKGVKYIQLSDPALVYMVTKPKKAQLKKIGEAVEVATKEVKAKTVLHTFFGNAKPILGEAATWAVSGLGVDLYETDVKALKGLKVSTLSLGLVDARNSIIEDPADLAKIAAGITKNVEAKDVVVSTTCDMDFLTWDKAEAKMRVLHETAVKLGGI